MTNVNGTTPRTWLFGSATRGLFGGRGLEAISIRCETLGRERSAKSTTLLEFGRGPLNAAAPSGLVLASPNPLLTTQRVQKQQQAYRHLQAESYPTSQADEVHVHNLFEADAHRATLEVRDTVGQVISRTNPDSPVEDQQRHEEQLTRVAKTDVALLFVSCPSGNSSAEQAVFEQDVELYTDTFRAALRKRTEPLPLAVGLVLTMIDARFADEAAARETLTEEVLRLNLGKLVRLLEDSPKVGLGALHFVTAFGFGNSVPAVVPAAAAGERRPAGVPSTNGLGEWRLKPGCSPVPFGLDTLAWWTLKAGLMLKPEEAEPARLARLLDADLKSADAWVVELACGKKQPAAAGERRPR
jgi:hypothetical protein